MKKVLKITFLLLFFITLFSCSSTKDFVSDVTMSESLTTEEKLEYYGGKEVSVNLPEMYFNGEEWYSRMMELIDGADEYILLSTFLGSSSPTLEPLFNLLEQKAKSGVKVYLIIDGTSNLDMTETRFVMTPLGYLRDSGVNLLIYSPMSFTHIVNPSSLIVRDHRKMMIIDGSVATIGGMNINYISMGAGEKCQRDSMYVFSSVELSNLFIDEFVQIWNEGSIKKMDKDEFKKESTEKGEYKAWLFNRNVFKSQVSLSGMFGSLINDSTSSIFLCPYLPTIDSNIAKSLRNAVERGVDTEIWCSTDSRGYAAKGGAYSLYKLLEETDVTYYDVSSDSDGSTLPLFHMKAMIVDDRYVVIGSSNFNYRSMTLSHELALVVDSPEMARIVKEKIKEVAKNPVLVTKEEAKENKKENGSYLCYLFSYYGG